MASPKFPEPPPSIPATSLEECDAAVERLSAAASRWAETGIPARIELLRATMERLGEVAPDWVAAACRAKGHAPGSSGEGEEWLGGPMTTMRNLRLLVEALEAGGQPKPPRLEKRGSQWVATVFPAGLKDRAMFAGFTAEVWIEPGKEPSQGRIYREKASGRGGHGGVGLVLGAGNQSSIGPMDLLYKLYVDDEVVVLKMNPVNEYLGPHIARAFAPFVERGFLQVVYGGAEVGAHLSSHPGVDSIHITGSNRTHDAIVWGPDPEEQARRKESGERANTKPITSELGAVTPLLVVPGPWTDAEVAYQARHAAAMVGHNASFNCNACKVLAMPKGWPRRDAFLAALADELRAIGPRKAYYPGAQDRYQAFLDRYPQARPLGERADDVVPWTLIPDVPDEEGEYALTNEAFCGVLAVVEIEGSDAPSYLANAVPFANDRCWGSLSCMMLVHPETRKQHGAAVERAIADLRYGGIGINVWSGVVYGLVVTTWGAFPGHPLEDIQSGRGVVHNTYLFDHPQKSVIEAPFVIKPTPAWFPTHKNLAQLGERMTAFEANPRWRALPGVAIAGFRG